MKVTTLIVLLCCLACGSGLFGQDLTMYEHMGKLTPHTPGTPDTAGQSLLVYRNRGLMFHVMHQCVLGVIVFTPAMARPAGNPRGGADIVVPGVSAFGIALGMSSQQVDDTPIAQRSRKTAGDQDRVVYEIGSHEMLGVSYADGRLTQIEVLGSFRTTEGITSSSSRAQIEQVYGRPDQQYDLQMKSFLWTALGLLLGIPISGLLTGLSIRAARRGGSVGPALPAVLGVIGRAVAGVVVGLCVIPANGFVEALRQLDWYGLAATCLAAGCAVLVMERLSPSLRDRLRPMATLAAMVIVSVIVTLILRTIAPGESMLSPGSEVLLATPFMIFLLIGAGLKKDTSASPSARR